MGMSSVGFVLLMIFLGLILLFLIICFIFLLIGIRLFGRLFVRPTPRPRVDRSPLHISQENIFGMGENWFYARRNDFENISMRSYDNLKLSAYFLRARKRKCNKLIVLVHGYNDFPSVMAAFAQIYLAEMDCHILMPHLRAHGMSYGNSVGFGLPDSQDLIMWVQYMEDYLDTSLEVIMHGRGMGAAAVLMTAGSRRTPFGLKGVISDASYESLKKEIAILYPMRSPLLFRIIAQIVNFLMMQRIGYGFSKISPLKYASNIKVPVLLFHGKEDAVVPSEMSEALYLRISAPKRMVIIEHAGHNMSYDMAPTRYEAEVKNFLKITGILEDSSKKTNMDEKELF